MRIVVHGFEIKIAFDTLAHSDARITQDTHQSALPHTGKNAARVRQAGGDDPHA